MNFGLARSMGFLGYSLSAAVMGMLTSHFGPEVIIPVYALIYLILIGVLISFPVPQKDLDAHIIAGNDLIQEKPSTIKEFIRKYHRFIVLIIGFSFLCDSKHNILDLAKCITYSFIWFLSSLFGLLFLCDCRRKRYCQRTSNYGDFCYRHLSYACKFFRRLDARKYFYKRNSIYWDIYQYGGICHYLFCYFSKTLKK